MALEDYKDLVGSAAGICTIAQMFSGVFICKDIVKQGSTKNVSVIPFLGGLVMVNGPRKSAPSCDYMIRHPGNTSPYSKGCRGDNLQVETFAVEAKCQVELFVRESR